MKLTLSQLRIVEALARTGSFSKAAQELGITQPSVSTQLRALEKQSEARLLLRDGRKISQSRLGALVLPKIRALLALANEIEATIEDERRLNAGLIRLGYSTHQFAMPVISRFMARHPMVKVETRSMASLDLLGLLRDGLIDAAMITAQTPPPEFAAEAVRTDEIVLMARADHPLAGRGRLRWRDLDGVPLLRREATSMTRVLFDDAAARAGMPIRAVLELGSWEAMRAAVREGIGLGVALEGEIEMSDDVAVLRIADDSLWATHFVVCLQEMREISVIRGMVAIATADS